MSSLSTYRVSSRGQMSLPAETRRRWEIEDGGDVEIVDLGEVLLVAPKKPGGLRQMVREAIDASGGYSALVADVIDDDPALT